MLESVHALLALVQLDLLMILNVDNPSPNHIFSQPGARMLINCCVVEYSTGEAMLLRHIYTPACVQVWGQGKGIAESSMVRGISSKLWPT